LSLLDLGEDFPNDVDVIIIQGTLTKAQEAPGKAMPLQVAAARLAEWL